VSTQEALDTKRKFVRFISHEIRTPMNTLCLGLKVLKDEIEVFIDSFTTANTTVFLTPRIEKNHNEVEVASKIRNWMDLILELQESSTNAVTVLNELLSYDKIEMNSFHIEKEVMSVWQLISNSIKPFNIQAREKGIQIEVDLDIDHMENSDEKKSNMMTLCLFGDPIKLNQVIRNIVSNALKFSKPQDIIRISARWKPDVIIEESKNYKILLLFSSF
jgi:signal transduction histidine kinase